ncbi:MAG: hypothetical protein K6B54_02180 [Clostridia bacterium]|nr:hypothetical protein [Clostridia bacterium]
MKNFKRLLIFVLVAALSAGMLAACGKSEPKKDKPTAEPANTAAPTDAPEETPEVTAEPEPTPTPKPKATPKPELGDNKGKIFAEGQEGVEVLYSENFDDREIDDVMEDAGFLTDPSNVEIIDGKLCLAYKQGVPVNEHQSFYPILDNSFDDYEQFEISFDYTIAYTDPSLRDAEWMALMIGFFITEPTNRIATSTGDGLFIGLNSKGVFPVYGVGDMGTVGGWPEGALKVKTGLKDVFDEEHRVTLVETGDMKAYLYIDGELICSIEVTDEKVTSYSAEGKLLNSKKNDPENQQGANFLLWTHCTGAIIDNVCVKAY